MQNISIPSRRLEKSKFIYVYLGALLCGAMTMVGCRGIKAPVELEHSAKLQPAKNVSDTLVYRNPNINAKKYTKFILEPVVVYNGTDNDFGDIPLKDRQVMAEFASRAFVNAFKGSRFPIVTTPGSDVVRVRFTLIGLTRSIPVAQGVTYILPYSLAMNLAKGALGKSGTFMGNTTLAAEFYDSRTGDIVGAFASKASPNAMNIQAALNGKYGASQAAVTDIMETIRKQADENHGLANRK